MENSLVEKLQDEIGTVSWPWLKPHGERDALFLIDPQMDLLDVAVHIAEDRVEQVRHWLETGKIIRPDTKQMDAWETANTMFSCLIVKPFVLIQLPS
ncbi:MAG: DUF2288 domain-containing protein [Deltaproteobacteria bacterium]|nr:DUF2288 domain-containing protein [Candidatus Anaeroferrophillus wilburensis]MBN2887942.1 DUF2288 domain-containing protein [Deltaproteobacteria bacterium]